MLKRISNFLSSLFKNKEDRMTTDKHKYTLGILAYGSLISEPGSEINELEIKRIDCTTPFNVEFARKSQSRSGAPTLIPVEQGGAQVSAILIVLKEGIDVSKAKSILYRRERHINNRSEPYIDVATPTRNQVVVKMLDNFSGVKTVLYTSIGKNIIGELSGSVLADYSIASILADAGTSKLDGLRYLLAAKRSGIRTALSDDYEAQILLKTGTTNLEKAIEMLDEQRMSKK